MLLYWGGFSVALGYDVVGGGGGVGGWVFFVLDFTVGVAVVVALV
jgi:hypothetical protein